MIIGNLNTGDYTVASFTLQNTRQNLTQLPGGAYRLAFNQTRDAGKAQNSNGNSLKVQIAYTDTMGTRQLVEKDVNIQSAASAATGTAAGSANFRGRSQPSFISTYGGYIAIFAALVILGLGYSRYRKGKSSNPDYKLTDIFKRKSNGRKK